MSFTPTPGFPDDEWNPYAQPEVEIGRRAPARLEPLSPIPFTLADVIRYSWETYRTRMGLCIGVVALVFGLNVAFSVFSAAVQNVLDHSGAEPPVVRIVSGVTRLVGVVFQLWLTSGQMLVLLKVARGQFATASEVFHGGRYLLRVILATILAGLVVMGVLVLTGIPLAVGAVIFRGDTTILPFVLVLGAVPPILGFIYALARISQYMYVIIDRDTSALNSLKASAALTNGQVGKLLVLWALASGINMLGLLSCLVGLIVTVPYTALLLAVVYVALAGQSIADQKPAGEFLPEIETG
jgi:hypothetical protein